jgi:hypothetical protein
LGAAGNFNYFKNLQASNNRNFQSIPQKTKRHKTIKHSQSLIQNDPRQIETDLK